MDVPLPAPLERPALERPGRLGASLRRLPAWLLFFLGWTVLALLMAGQYYVSWRGKHGTSGTLLGDGSFASCLRAAFTEWYVWAALSPLILQAARRLSVPRLGLARAVSVHLVLAVVFTALQVVGHVLIDVVVEYGWYGTSFDAFAHWRLVVLTGLVGGSAVYVTMVVLVHGFDAYREYRHRQLTASQLETRLAQAQLQLLQVQMQPHFLFNTLHAISALMHQDVEAADRMLARLSELLRFSLESVGTQEVPLRRELEFLAPYLDIERRRFGEKLTVVLDVAPDVLDAPVPSLLLQPLVENAIRHGVAPRVAPGRVEVRARREGDRLAVWVVDDGAGAGPRPAQALSHGLGLQNTRARLEGLYGEQHTFRCGNRPGGGFEVALSLPLPLARAAARA